MAQGLDLKTWNGDKSPSMDSKSAENVKKTRGIGSRRIFPPTFKLQVLDSYRNDVDCRGNQRATARKYNIHRRQIQKWLQCEKNLRTTVEETAKNELSDSKPQKIVEDKTDLTLNQSATAFARLGDAGRPKENKLIEESKLEAQNLKRVAQKLYPSLQSIPCMQGEKVIRPSDGQKFYRGGDIGCEFRLPPVDARDDNFNKVIRTDGGPLDLKSKVRSEMLPEFLASNAGGPLAGDDPDKISMGEDEESSSPSEIIDGQKLSVVSNGAVLKCLVRKYTDDVGGQKFYAWDAENEELLCSSTSKRTESSSLSDNPVPKNPVPYSPAKRALEDVASDLNLPVGSPDTCHKKPKSDTSSECKSFNPKRKWMKESMQEMEDAEHSQDTSSLPIKQRVKMNLRSLPEAFYASEDSNRAGGISSDFTIERLCSITAKENKPSYRNYSHHHVQAESYYSENDRLSPIGIPLKEERVSDSEDVDIDIVSTTPVEKKSFDFSTYNFGKRRSFSVQFKLTVLDAFYNDKDCNKNQRATARKFNINRRQVQKWLSQESDLRSEGSVKNGKYLHRQRLGGDIREGEGCTGCPQHCLRKKEIGECDKTIEVNVEHCSDDCLSRRYHQDDSKTNFYSKNFFQSDLKTNFLNNYLFPENNNLIYHDSILGWPNLNTSALSVPNFQYLSTWHHGFDFCPENQKIC